jgi:CheY-like chemotaxis protein
MQAIHGLTQEIGAIDNQMMNQPSGQGVSPLPHLRSSHETSCERGLEMLAAPPGTWPDPLLRRDSNEKGSLRFSNPIFLVEDDVANGELLLELLLRVRHYNALLFADAFQVLKAVQFVKPLLFIFDYRLPHMNGVALYNQLHAKEELHDVPAIILTASLDNLEDEVHSRGLVALSKPFDSDEFLATVEKVVEERKN